MPKIYACYRHDDDAHAVARVVGDIRSCFGPKSVFYDQDSIRAGKHWPRHLKKELTNSDVLLAFIGHNWHRSWDEDVGPRLWNADDWVRREICTAIDSRRVVIPVLIDNVAMPKPSALPSDCSLKWIPYLQWVQIRVGVYNLDIQTLIREIGDLTNSTMAVNNWLTLRQMSINQNVRQISITK
jgi:TIR domain